MFTLAAWIQSVNEAAAYTALNAAADPILTVSTTKVLCPAVNNIVLGAAGLDSTAAARCRFVSPSLLTLDRLQIKPFSKLTGGSVIPTSPLKVADYRFNPLPLVVGEQITFEAIATPGAARIQYGLLWLGDGAIKPVNGKIYTVRATGGTAAVAITWTNVALTFDDALPRGRYQIVGMRGESASMIAARLVIPGTFWRPGVLGMQLPDDADPNMTFRFGNFGVFGEFEDTTPPTVDILCATTDATQEFWFDLIQVRAGGGGP